MIFTASGNNCISNLAYALSKCVEWNTPPEKNNQSTNTFAAAHRIHFNPSKHAQRDEQKLTCRTNNLFILTRCLSGFKRCLPRL